MKNVFLILISLAFISFVQAGPFGLKSGMTVDEIIETGFKVDKKQYESLTGGQWFPLDIDNLENLKSDKSPPNKKHKLYQTTVVNSKYPNTLFYLRISKLCGLTGFHCFKYVGINKPISNEALKKLFQSYCETIEKKYKAKSDSKVWKSYSLYPPVNNIKNIWISHSEIDDSKPMPKNKYIMISYEFLAKDLHYKKLEDNSEKEQKEEIKNLIPKEEDL